MESIQNNLRQFTDSLEQHAPVFCKNGEWESESGLISIIRHLFYGENSRLISISQAFCEALDSLERSPVTFNSEPKAIAAQKEHFQLYLEAGRAVKKTLQISNDAQIQNELKRLSQKITALKYRIEGIHGGLDKGAVDQDLLEKLLHQAGLWKSKQGAFPDKSLSAFHRKKMAEACCYPKFVKMLLRDHDLQNGFFAWTLRENNGIEQFIEYPVVCTRLKAIYLSTRIGRFGGDMLSVEKAPDPSRPGLKEKVISLLFNTPEGGKPISILDESLEVNLNGHWKLPIHKIFRCFAKKKEEIGDIEFFGSTGITNWNAHKLGWWDPAANSHICVDLTSPRWWEMLPVFEELSKDQVEQKYSLSLGDGDWLVSAMASRETLDLDLDRRHGYLVATIPTELGRYRVYPFGKFPELFPGGKFALMTFLASTVLGKVSYPDENEFYSHRQKAAYPIKLMAKQGMELMEIIKEELFGARHGNAIFQFIGENCAFWVQATLEKVKGISIPNFFKLATLKSEPQNGPLRYLFFIMRRSPEYLQPSLLKMVDTLLGSWRQIRVIEDGEAIYKSVRKSSYRAQHIIFQPGHLHQQIEKGLINGTIYFGHE